MTAVDRDPATLAHAVLDTVVPDVPWKIQLHEFQARAAAAPTLARAVIDLTAKVERMEALEAALEKVLRLHPRVVVLHADPEFGRMEDDAICGACIVNHAPADWPCPNVVAITTALEGANYA